MSSVRETKSVGVGEELPLERLLPYLHQHIEEMPDDSVTVEQFAAGHSNLTYLIRSGSWEAVLRRPPMGTLPPKAHDMSRESNWLAALHPHFSLAPKPYVFCDDTSVIGAPFFVMERRRGVVVDKEWPDVFGSSEENAVHLTEALVDTLVELHAIDYTQTQLVHKVKPDGYMERQVTGLVHRYGLAKTEDSPEANEVGAWMVKNLPVSPLPTIIHNDLKLNNMLFSVENPRVPTAVLDWEMSTVGDPLSDLSIVLGYWTEASDPMMFRKLVSPMTTFPGFPKRDDVVEMYAKKSGRNVDHMNYYMVFASFKSAVICQQIYYRFAMGQTRDERFAHMGLAANELVRRAHDLAFKGAELR